jgi:hypothetical protein
LNQHTEQFIDFKPIHVAADFMSRRILAAKPAKADVLEQAKTELHQSKRAHSSVGKATAQQTAQYIADMLLELRNMSRGAGLDQLTYFLEMAFYEAFDQSNKVGRSKSDRLTR